MMRTAFAVLAAIARDRCWPLLAVSIAAWTLMGFETFAGTALVLCASGAASPFTSSVMAAALEAGLSVVGVWSAIVMVAAMMLPLLPIQMLRVWDGSLADRRGRALALFLVGYLVVAVPVVLVLAIVAAISAMLLPAWAVTSAYVATAALWQLTSAKRHAMLRCHRRPVLPLFGLRAEAARLRFGVESGAACMTSCWAVMLVPFGAGPLHFAAMVAASVFLLGERFGATEPLGSSFLATARQVCAGSASRLTSRRAASMAGTRR